MLSGIVRTRMEVVEEAPIENAMAIPIEHVNKCRLLNFSINKCALIFYVYKYFVNEVEKNE